MSDSVDYDTADDGDVIEPPVITHPVMPTSLPVVNNPFAIAAPDHINAGAVTIESQRGIAEVQGRMLIAKRFPRDGARAWSAAMDACRRIGLAKEAIYKYRRGGLVEGPSIRLAEEMARCWGNVEYGLNELSRRDGESEMEAFAWDLETNTRSSQRFTVRHLRERGEEKGGSLELDGERDIYEITANMGARRMRSRILAILPPELVRDAVAQCKQTQMQGGGEVLADRIYKMIEAFRPMGVTADMISDRVGHTLDRITPDELVDLHGIYQSLKDRQSKIGDWFGRREQQVALVDAADAFGRAAAGLQQRTQQRPPQQKVEESENPAPKQETPSDPAQPPPPAGKKAPVELNPAEKQDAEVAAFIEGLARRDQAYFQKLDADAVHRQWLKGLTKPQYERVAQAIAGEVAARRAGSG